MKLITSDEEREVDIGRFEIWRCLISTVVVRLASFRERAPLAFAFLENGECQSTVAAETAREMNLVRDALAGVSPDEAVYDLHDPERAVPWEGKISPVITSCNTMFTTADGKDLLYEVVSILCYAGVKKVNVAVQ